jgi:penicillin-insensitive murein endopeptidase
VVTHALKSCVPQVTHLIDSFSYSRRMSLRLILSLIFLPAVIASTPLALAQTKGSVDLKPLPPLANPNDPAIGAKELFGRKVLPTKSPVRVVGFYAKGCIAGAEALPINGPTWQVMRLSRNRNWAHPQLVELLERLSVKANKNAGWPGILVGDMSQPRGGPMITGHASHQVGLDADIWLTPMPNRQLSRNEREEMSAVMMVRHDRLDIDPTTWTPSHLPVIRAAALEPSVERIFVNAAIKKALCREAKGDRSWLSKVRPMYGHDYHFHVRIKCPVGSAECESQPPPTDSEGCSAGDLAYWFSDAVLHPKPPPVPPKPKPPMTLAEMPAACRQVLTAP